MGPDQHQAPAPRRRVASMTVDHGRPPAPWFFGTVHRLHRGEIEHWECGVLASTERVERKAVAA